MIKMNVKGNRLWSTLMEIGKIGATSKGGVCRIALTDLDKQGRDLFIYWCKDAGCTVSIDRMGNIFVRRAGQKNSLPVVMTGSHLDTQPTGGKFDGIYGVMAGLEVIRTLNDYGYQTKAPIEVAVWTNEEGVRFPPMIGSGVFTGQFNLETGLSYTDHEGKTLGEELQRIGYAGNMDLHSYPVQVYFEAHIEQGPVLFDGGTTIGVVTGARGQRWYNINLTGVEAHAGPTPMDKRKDAMAGAARMICEIHRIGSYPDACSTVGYMKVHPNSRNVIPGKVSFTADLRHPDNDFLKAMDLEMREICQATATEIGLDIDIQETFYFPATPFDDAAVAAVNRAARHYGYSYKHMISGAGHDAVYIASVIPTSMIFVPCKNGISHNECEDANPEDLEAGCNVLLHSMLSFAGRCKQV